MRGAVYFAILAALILLVGFAQSWNTALLILNMGMISAIMSLGVNMQWGYAGLFNIGVMGFVALGGLGAVLVSMPPTEGAWSAGGWRVMAALAVGAAAIWGAIVLARRLRGHAFRGLAVAALPVAGFVLYRIPYIPGVEAIEAISPALTGNLGGLGLPVILSWPVGGLLAAGAAWIVGKTALGLRSDYLAIATLGIAEIIVSILKNEDWLSRGVKNVIGIPRPVPYEIDLQRADWFRGLTVDRGFDPVTSSSIFVKFLYFGLFATVLLVLVWLMQRALHSPWGRMMRAIRDNETAARAMGKDVTGRHLQIFVLGSAVCGVAGAMLITLDGQLTPGSFTPLRYTFTIWLMVIIGGSGNNWGAILGAFLIWFLWIKVDPWGNALMWTVTQGMADGSNLKQYLMDSAAQMRTVTMGLILLLVLRFSPRGLIPEK